MRSPRSYPCNPHTRPYPSHSSDNILIHCTIVRTPSHQVLRAGNIYPMLSSRLWLLGRGKEKNKQPTVLKDHFWGRLWKGRLTNKCFLFLISSFSFSFTCFSLLQFSSPLPFSPLTHSTCFYLKFFLLQLTYDVLSISAAQQSNPVIHIHTFFFSCYRPSCSIPRDWMQFPVRYSRTPLPIHSKCSILHP